MRKGTVGIIGCGWLGFPLALKLLSEGYSIYGTTTQASKLDELEAAGIQASVLKLPMVDFQASAKTFEPSVAANPSTQAAEQLWSCDQLVIIIPPNRKDPNSAKTYPAAVLSALLTYRRHHPSGRIIFTSSIGVYGKDHSQAIHRDTRLPIENPSARQASLLLAESQVQAQSQRPHRILRLGGLYGGTRDPKKWFAGRDVPRPDDPTNLVSRDRVVNQIVELLDEPFWSGESIWNVVDEDHPTRGEAYR